MPGLPLAPILAPHQSGRLTSVFGVRSIDLNGRVIDRFVVDALGWTNGDRLCWRVCDGIGVISAAGVPGVRVSGRGHLWLPAGLRHAARLEAGDRVFLAADTIQSALAVFPPSAVEEMVTRWIRDQITGGRS
ncbi:hypothetical protein ACQPW1_23020 [Nocardia sp. CA-128927]|uniref:hypothetical protein n=1 Tax=Nocardia sp. CA-128927 TaxID=3239975 RepID=UPI003D951D5D